MSKALSCPSQFYKKFKMRFALAVLVVLAVAYIATAQESGENQVYSYYPFYGPNARLFFTTTTTTTSVTTSTSTLFCTSSIYAKDAEASVDLDDCSGRRRRGIQFEEDDKEQFSISPSAVQGVEATASPIREARAADPQYYVMAPFGYHPYYPQEIQPGFYGPGYFPYYGSYAQPAAGNRIFLSTILNAVLPTFLKQTSTVTVTSTAFAVTTSNSVPTCKPVAATLQCA